MLLCFISTTFWQCQKEELETIESTKQGKLNLWVVPGEKAFNESKQLRERVTSLKRKNTAARLTSTIYNFSIEEEHVQIIIGDDYTQYTFNVERDNPTPNLLENYVCKIYTDGEVFQYLMGYPYTIGQNGISYQMQNSSIQVITDENIIVNTAARGFPPGCVPEFISESSSYQCTSIPCSQAGHEYGDHTCECGITVNCTPASQSCGWITITVYGCGGGGSTGSGPGGDGGFGAPAGGGSTTPGTTTPVEPVVTVPFGNINDIKKCEELNNLMNNDTIKSKIEILKQEVNTSSNEKGYNFKKDPTGNYSSEFINGEDSELPFNIGGDYFAGAHIHTAKGFDFFSFTDLWNSIKYYEKSSPENESESTLMLISNPYLVGDNINVYAIKIKKFTEFKLRFYQTVNTMIPGENLTIDQKIDRMDQILGKEYRKLKAENKPIAIALLKLIKKDQVGIYKANSALTNWSEMTTLNNELIEQPCN
jgi:hypothetical protein